MSPFGIGHPGTNLRCSKNLCQSLIIDVTRCSVALADPADLMEAFQLLTSQESQDKLGYKIVRYKNTFEPKSTDTFKNIMVNALVRRVRDLSASVCRSPFQRRRSGAPRTDVELVGEL